MDSGPVQALQLRDQPQPASAATGSATANGAGRGLHVTASTFPRPPCRARGGSGRFRGGPRSPAGVSGPRGGPGSGVRGGRLLAAEQVHGAGTIAVA